jgi:hypothetical protein
MNGKAFKKEGKKVKQATIRGVRKCASVLVRLCLSLTDACGTKADSKINIPRKHTLYPSMQDVMICEAFS